MGSETGHLEPNPWSGEEPDEEEAEEEEDLISGRDMKEKKAWVVVCH